MEECPFPSEVLTQKLASRDPMAWDWVYGRYAPMVYAIAVKKLREAEARDVTQTVFVEFLRILEQGAQVQYLGGFLHKIAVRRTLDALKKRLTDENRRQSLDTGSTPDGEERGGLQLADGKAEAPVDGVAGDEEGVLVRRLTRECLDGLSAPEKMAAELLVARMRGENELSWAEIRDLVKKEHRKSINLARVFEKFRVAFARHWNRTEGSAGLRREEP